MLVKTRAGYVFETDDPTVKVGKMVQIPIPKVEKTTTMPKQVLNFVAQVYATQKNWGSKALGKYSIPQDGATLPPYFKTLDEDLLWYFLGRVYNIGAKLIVHRAGGDSTDMPEVHLHCTHKTLAEDFQHIWHRLGVKTRILWNSQRRRWVVRTSGFAAYVEVRSLLKQTKNSKIGSRMVELDQLVPFKYRVADNPMKDRVMEILDGEPEEINV